MTLENENHWNRKGECIKLVENNLLCAVNIIKWVLCLLGVRWLMQSMRGARGIVGLSGLQRVAWRAVLQATVLCWACAIELMTDSGRPVRQLHNLGHANLATASAPTCLNTRGRSPDTPQSAHSHAVSLSLNSTVSALVIYITPHKLPQTPPAGSLSSYRTTVMSWLVNRHTISIRRNICATYNVSLLSDRTIITVMRQLKKC